MNDRSYRECLAIMRQDLETKPRPNSTLSHEQTGKTSSENNQPERPKMNVDDAPKTLTDIRLIMAQSSFWDLVDKLTPDDCWNWKGTLLPSGYGTFRIGSKKWLAHRIAYTLTYGTIPEGLFICHVCDNPKCCNPVHLFMGTHQQNMDYCKAKGRTNFGEKQNSAKLTDAQVIEIRSRYQFRKVTSTQLSSEFGITRPTLSAIINNKTWRHLPLCTTSNNYIKQQKENL